MEKRKVENLINDTINDFILTNFKKKPNTNDSYYDKNNDYIKEIIFVDGFSFIELIIEVNISYNDNDFKISFIGFNEQNTLNFKMKLDKITNTDIENKINDILYQSFSLAKINIDIINNLIFML